MILVLLCAVAEPVHLPCRFSYVALNCCSLLDRLEVLNVPRAVDFLVRCKNFDGSFGHVPGQHSTICLHAQCLLPAFPPDCVHMLAGQKPACLAAAPLLLAVTMHSAPAEHHLVAAAPRCQSEWGAKGSEADNLCGKSFECYLTVARRG